MRILLILILIAAGLIVWQAHKHGCKYDSTLINCVMGKSGGEQPAAETPAPAAQHRRPRHQPRRRLHRRSRGSRVEPHEFETARWQDARSFVCGLTAGC